MFEIIRHTKYSNEVVDSFDTLVEAKKMLIEYRLSDKQANYMIKESK
jgi:hypothetical protein